MKMKLTEPPRIANRSDALELPDSLLAAESVRGLDIALEALKDAIEREVL